MNEVTSVLPTELQNEFGTFRSPDAMLKEAQMVATAFGKKARAMGLYKKIGDSEHLLIEGWQMLGSMYRVSAGIESTQFVQYGDASGFEAVAIATYVPTGRVISRAEAVCLDDEENWGNISKYEWVAGADGKREKVKIGDVPKPLQQLRSMAQTRAMSKVYSNLLKFVAKMASFNTTPAEEMTGGENGAAQNQNPQRATSSGAIISEPQSKRLYAIAKSSGKTDDQVKAILAKHGFDSTKVVTKDKYEQVCSEIEAKAAPSGSATGGPPADLKDYVIWPDGIEDEWVKFKGEIYRFDSAKGNYQVWSGK